MHCKAVAVCPPGFKFVSDWFVTINPIQDGLFGGSSRMERGAGVKKAPLAKICHTYPTMMALGTVIPYPKKIQKRYESRSTPVEFC